MEREFTRESLRGVYRMLFELAKGNFAYQIRRTQHHDELEGLIALFNMTAEKLNRNRNQFLWINRHNEVVVVKTLSFLLNRELQVLDYNAEDEKLKEFAKSGKIKRQAFENLLTPESRIQWRNALQQLFNHTRNFISLLLEYELHDNLELNLPSVIAKVHHEDIVKFIVTSSLLDTQKDEFFNFQGNANLNNLSI
ncbi:hypothetical protein RM553_16900 [Zunongwangia sp. F363]|uniref:HAMP domain-containing protein n=1 Tax=Autumnicola tepida TaxID=3075595 RepID=A0ABU3CDZ3_9FLAO|nr:hypothetical protein [Zunongwangia sp. F363]MDT0644521.1 hypothetical protein [Zunongwangia sp. F363]